MNLSPAAPNSLILRETPTPNDKSICHLGSFRQIAGFSPETSPVGQTACPCEAGIGFGRPFSRGLRPVNRGENAPSRHLCPVGYRDYTREFSTLSLCRASSVSQRLGGEPGFSSSRVTEARDWTASRVFRSESVRDYVWVHFLEFRSRDSISLNVNLSAPAVTPYPTPASIFRALPV